MFAYSLGYNNNDYKPINNSVTLSDTRDHLWTRLNEVNNHSGLYNGNISWMVTDLSKIGEINNDRSKGMQAMVYQYDQLHRIVKSRSLTSYAVANGFASRSASPAPYDENYTYDPNGNLLTLHRRNQAADTLHNFNYQYYPNTNKLRQVGPPEDMVFNGGALVSNNKLYRKITVQGNAYIPQGRPVELRALEEIEMDPDFEAADGTDFWAHIVADSGMYQYDKIGNLILDQHEGVKIIWTPYGKVREVKAKNDSLITTFRYDGAGNRIEKRVTNKDSVDIISVTHYVRDASGNVMGIYTDSMMLEQYVYGSSRVGLYKGGRYNGQRSLGEKNYELSNHLGNVLAVISDNIGMSTPDSVWATLINTSDYYPFGLEMQGRMWSDTTSTYRYGFNGKEKDDKTEFGNTSYDYGFRIYNPAIAKFLSVDPLTKSYPMLTPYQFASNRPIDGIDLDGLEFYEKGKLDLVLLGYRDKQCTLDDIAISNRVGSMVLDGNAPSEQFDDNYEQQEYISFSKFVPNRNTYHTGKSTLKVTNVPIYSSDTKGTLLGVALEVLAYYRMLSKEQQENLNLVGQAAALDLAASEFDKIKSQLPDEIKSNPIIKADIINFATDFRTLPSFNESDINEEYIQLIQTIGYLIYDSYTKGETKQSRNRFTKLSILEYNKSGLDRPSHNARAVVNEGLNDEIKMAFEKYRNSKGAPRGKQSLKKNGY